MKYLAAMCMIVLAAAAALAAEDTPPPWAYPVAPPAAKPAAPAPPLDPEPKRVPGSDVALTLAQIRDIGRGPPDWHPNDHPPMPEVVAKGRAGGVLACGYCHLPNGLGRPENSGIAGLPVEYIVHQRRRGAHRRAIFRELAAPEMDSGCGKRERTQDAGGRLDVRD
jgi:cytochrome c553